MNRLFGKKRKEPKPTLADASSHLDTRCEVVDARVAKLDAELLKLKELIQCTHGMTQQRHKQRAVQLLQQKRQYLGQQNAMLQQQFNIDQLQFTTESMRDTQVQVQALKDATATLRKGIKNLNIDKVDKLQDELTDLYADAQELQNIMGRTYDVPEDIDEDEMLGELEALDFNTEKVQDNSYLADALAMPGQKLPQLPNTVNSPIDDKKQDAQTDPYTLEAQLGL